jgi:hypothetical protein
MTVGLPAKLQPTVACWQTNITITNVTNMRAAANLRNNSDKDASRLLTRRSRTNFSLHYGILSVRYRQRGTVTP